MTVGTVLELLAAIVLGLAPLWLTLFLSGWPDKTLESDLTRIESKVRRARREVEQLEAEAMRAIQDEAVRRRLGR